MEMFANVWHKFYILTCISSTENDQTNLQTPSNVIAHLLFSTLKYVSDFSFPSLRQNCCAPQSKAKLLPLVGNKIPKSKDAENGQNRATGPREWFEKIGGGGSLLLRPPPVFSCLISRPSGSYTGVCLYDSTLLNYSLTADIAANARREAFHLHLGRGRVRVPATQERLLKTKVPKVAVPDDNQRSLCVRIFPPLKW